MSNTSSHHASYVRTEMLPEQAPPVTQAGVVKWLRENLFSSVLNSAMTVIALFVIYVVLSGLIPWVFGGVWNAGSLTECRTVLAAFGGDGHSGACWAVIEDRWLQLTFGFYPPEMYWRPILAFVLMAVALAPVLFSDAVPRQLMLFSVIYPFLAVWLIWGGSVWVPILVALGFGVGYLVFQISGRIVFSGLAVGLGILASVFWWLYGVSAIDNTINRMVGDSRYEATLTDLEAQIAALPAEVAEREATIEAIEAEVAAVVAERDAVAETIAAGASDLPSLQDQLLDHQRTLTGLRDGLSGANRALTVSEAALSQAERSLARYQELPTRVAGLTDLRAAIGDAETAEDRAEARAAYTLERDRIAETYGALGRVGLEPVESREIGGFLLALILGISGIVLSFPLGILLALGRQSDLFILNKFSVIFIEVIRGVPLIVWLTTASLLLNYFLPPGTTFDLVLRVVIMVTFFASAYMAEVIRGGLAALPRGQYEGADSLGLNYSQSMRLIILPQALKISIPGIVSTFIGLFKDTTLVVFIGLLDPIGFSNSIRADTDWNGVYWEIFIFIGLCFFVFCYGMSQYSQYLERKLRTDHR